MIVTVAPCVSEIRRAARKSGMIARCRDGVFDTYPKPVSRKSDTPDQQCTRTAWKVGKQGWTALAADEQNAWNSSSTSPRMSNAPHRTHPAGNGSEQRHAPQRKLPLQQRPQNS